MINFTNDISFFEHMRMADSERVHSEFLSWLLSNDCKALSSNEKIKLLNNIFKINGTDEILFIGTEIDKIDIFIETKNLVLIIENKLKSSQHSNQLFEYKEYVKRKYPEKSHKFLFLTLIKEQANSDDWTHISYYDILNYLTKIELSNHRHSVFIQEYILYLSKLLYVLNDVINNSNKYIGVFTNGSLKKSDKLHLNYENEKDKFIAKNQLETIFQKAFLTELLSQRKFQKFNGFLTETRGVALIDFSLERNIKYKNKIYTTFIQMQGQNIKFAFAIQENYLKSKKKWIDEILILFKTYNTQNYFGYKKYNSPKSKAYVSISKKMEKPYWLLERNELYSIIKSEIENGYKLSNMLINDIKTVGNKVYKQ